MKSLKSHDKLSYRWRKLIDKESRLLKYRPKANRQMDSANSIVAIATEKCYQLWWGPGVTDREVWQLQWSSLQGPSMIASQNYHISQRNSQTQNKLLFKFTFYGYG